MKRETVKTLIIGILVGIIIAGGTGTVIAYNISSNSVNFTPTDSAWQVNSVAEAIDDLYIKKTGDNYSTEERVVGTWIDGKPIYQKTVSFTSGTSNGHTFPNFLGVSNIETVVDINVMLKPTAATNEWLNASSYQTHVAFSYEAGNDSLRMWSENTQGGWWWSKPAVCTIQYTKTTDQVSGSEQAG